MNHNEWLEWRREGIGSSDAVVIMGASPWATPLQLWEEKILGKTKADNYSMQRGRQLEEPARLCFEEMMKVMVFPLYAVKPGREWMRASFDGVDLDKKIAVEIKCPGREDHSVALNNMIPEKYYPQLQHQLEVLGLDAMYYFSFDGANGVVVEVSRDDEYIKGLIQAEADFYQCMINKIPPELTERDYENKENDPIWLEKEAKFAALLSQKNELEKELDTIKEDLIVRSGEKNCSGKVLRLTKSIVKGSVDYSKVPELSGVNLEGYRKKSFTRWTPSVI